MGNYLNSGDTVEIIATSGKASEACLKKASAYIETLGYQVHINPGLLGRDPIYANTKEARRENLRKALLNEESKLLWCLRGGSGATGLLPFLEKMPPPPKEKLVVGFSDVTCLHLFFHQKWSWKPLHAPTLNKMLESDFSQDSKDHLHSILKGKVAEFTLEGLNPLNKMAKQAGVLKAPLTGGNLSLIQSSLGTPWQIQTKGKILILEDVDEEVYRTLERLEHLSQANIFEGLKGLILGDFNFNKSERPETEKFYHEQFKIFSNKLPFPVLRTKNIGHGKNNLAFQLGSEASLNLGESPSIKLPYL